MNTEKNASGKPSPGASRHLGHLVALAAGGLIHHEDFRHRQAHPTDQRTIYITIGVKTDGSTDRPEEICQVVGLEGNSQIGGHMKKMFTDLQEIATVMRSQAQGIGEGTHQANDPSPARIAQLAGMCCKVHLSGKDTSGYKDLITGFVRLGLGEMLAAVMRKVGAAYIGISQAMFDKGMEVLKNRDNVVHRTNSAKSQSKGAKQNKRPNIRCTWRSLLMNMCKSAQDWESRASFTSFICALAYSITQGQDTGMLDNWKITDVTAKPWKKKGKGKEEDEMEGNKAEEAGPEGVEVNITGSRSQIKKNKPEKEEALYPGNRGVLHNVSDTHLKMVFECMLSIFAAGGFWLMPHAHAPFDENMLRGSGERPKFVLMKQVHEFVRKKLGVSASGEEDRAYSNWWTLANNKQVVKHIFSQPREEMGQMGFIWIPVNPKQSAVSMGHTLGNVLHNLDPSVRKDTKKPKKNEEKCKDDEKRRDSKEQNEQSEENEEETEEISDSPADDEDEDAEEAKVRKRKRMKGGKKQLDKKEEKLLTVKEHEDATRKASDVFGFLLALVVPDDNVSAQNYLTAKPMKRTHQPRRPRVKPNEAAPRALQEEILRSEGVVGESRPCVDGGGDGELCDNPDRSESGIHAAELIEVDGGWDGELCDNLDGSESGFHALEQQQQLRSPNGQEVQAFRASFVENSAKDKKVDMGFEFSGNKELGLDDAAEGRASAGSTPAAVTAATAATTGATGATATPAAAPSGFTLVGSSQGSSLAPAASGLVKGRDRGTPNGSALVRASKESGRKQKAELLSNSSDRNTGGWATRAKGTLEDAEDDEERRDVEHNHPPGLEVLEKVGNVHDMQVVNDDDAEEEEEEDGSERRGRDRHGHSELIKLGAAGAGKDRDGADRHRHSELIKIGAAGAGKSGKIGVWGVYAPGRPLINDADARLRIPARLLNAELTCLICLSIVRNTHTFMECLHRFCQDCIEKHFRLVRKDCPNCRVKVSSRRALRADPAFDEIIQTFHPDIDAYVEQEEQFISRVNAESHSMANVIEEGLRRQASAAGAGGGRANSATAAIAVSTAAIYAEPRTAEAQPPCTPYARKRGKAKATSTAQTSRSESLSTSALQARGGGDSGVSTSTLKRAAAAEAGGASSASAPMPKRQMPTKQGSGLVPVPEPPLLERWAGRRLVSAGMPPPRSESVPQTDAPKAAPLLVAAAEPKAADGGGKRQGYLLLSSAASSFESSGKKELDQDCAAQGEGRAAAGSTPAAATGETTGATGATTTPAAAASGFSLGGSSPDALMEAALAEARLWRGRYFNLQRHLEIAPAAATAAATAVDKLASDSASAASASSTRTVAAGSTPAAATGATTGATGATATPAAAASGFTLGGSSQDCPLAPAASAVSTPSLMSPLRRESVYEEELEPQVDETVVEYEDTYVHMYGQEVHT